MGFWHLQTVQNCDLTSQRIECCSPAKPSFLNYICPDHATNYITRLALALTYRPYYVNKKTPGSVKS